LVCFCAQMPQKRRGRSRRRRGGTHKPPRRPPAAPAVDKMPTKETELASAAYENRLETMERLLAEGVSADAKDEHSGYPALLRAAEAGHLDALELLRRHGHGLLHRQLEATGPDGSTALIFAATWGNVDCTEALLEWGADKDAATNKGNTALHQAARFGELQCVRLLVRVGADRAKRNQQGKTALEVARQMGCTGVAALLEQADADVSSSAPSPLLVSVLIPVRWPAGRARTRQMKKVTAWTKKFIKAVAEPSVF